MEGKPPSGGIAQNDPSKMEKITLGAYYYTVGGTQILLKYGKEFATRDGMKTSDDFLVRFQWWFK